MDHDQVREQLELAAVEPGGLERLMAGDTETARAVAAHLAGCPSCAMELERIERAVPLLRDVVRTTPPADLRERTLAFVAANGIPRGAMAAASAGAPTLAAVPPRLHVVDPLPVDESTVAAVAAVDGDVPTVAAPAPDRQLAAARARRSRGLLPWVAAIAAAVVLSVVATTLIVGARVDDRLTALDRQIEGLETVTLATIDITAEPDTQRVALSSTGGAPASGNLLYSPTTEQLVVVASGLTKPPSGQEYRCWVEIDGTRTSIGKMFFSNDLAYWVGAAPSVAGVDEGAQFGVSLTTPGSPSAPLPPVLAGEI